MQESVLSKVNFPSDLKPLSIVALEQLAAELRAFVIEMVAKNGGHLGASLGVVELSIALHYVFDTPNDALIWDVGHQAYIHKILTGRKNLFETNRKINGISGFPKRDESVYDSFGTGHSSTSISAILGMAIASKLKQDINKQHIAVIGDASIASGMAFEALNHLGVTDVNVLIILNDNAIGIDPSVGALKNYFTSIKNNNSTQNNIFKDLNIPYYGVVDGHNLSQLIKELTQLKNTKGVKLLHINTIKGKGLKQAEEHQVTYHSPGKFDKLTGAIYEINKKNLPLKYQDIFGKTLVKLAELNPKIVGITPAMLTGSSMKLLIEKYPERTFDVGIAEQHAVTLAAGIAAQGMIPFCNVYSTFLQRAYDQIIHDVALQKLPVIFCLDRAGLVGDDGATHHGVFDIAYLNCIPNMQIIAPLNEIELQNALFTVQNKPLQNPVAIRYPKGLSEFSPQEYPFEVIDFTAVKILQKGTKIAILSTGTIGNNIQKALQKIENSKIFSHYHFIGVKPLNITFLDTIFKTYNQFITIEDGVIKGGFGNEISTYLAKNKVYKPIQNLGIPDVFIEHGTITELQKICGIDVESLAFFLKRTSKKELIY